MIEYIINLLLGSADCYQAFDWAGLGLGIGALGTAASGIGSAIANAKRQGALANQRIREGAWYDKQMYEDPTKRSDNAALLSLLDQKLKKYNKTQEQKGVITNTTPEANLAAREASAQTYGNAISGMMSGQSARYDMLAAQKRAAENQAFQSQDALDAARLETWKNLASNATKLGDAAIGGLEVGDKTKGIAFDLGKSLKKAQEETMKLNMPKWRNLQE